MKYDCFFYDHMNFGADLFSAIPSFKNHLQGALYQKALFLLFVKGNPHDMLTGSSWNLQHERQYRVFVFEIKIQRNFPHRAKPFVFLRTYFFCRLKEDMITLGNLKSVIYAGLVTIVSAFVTFVAEVCSKEMVFLMLTK